MGGQRTNEKEEDESEGRSELILQQVMDNETVDTAVTITDVIVIFGVFYLDFSVVL